MAAANQNALSSPAIPLRSSATRSVNRGGLNRRRPREQVPVDSATNKRHALGDPSTSAANEDVQVEDLELDAADEVQGHNVNATGPGPTGSTSLLSGSSSSLREKMRELITTPNFLSNLSPGIFYQFPGWIQKKEVPLSDALAASFAPPSITLGKIYQPNWDVREDESLYSDIPENGGILAYHILKGM